MIEVLTEGRYVTFDSETHAWRVNDGVLTVVALPATEDGRTWSLAELNTRAVVVAQFREWSGVVQTEHTEPRRAAPGVTS